MDSDHDNKVGSLVDDESDGIIANYEQMATSMPIRNQQRFLTKYNLKTKAGDTDTTVIDHAKKYPYKFGNEMIQTMFFDHVGLVFANGDTQYWLERQLSISGQYIDLDILQDNKEPILNGEHMYDLCQHIVVYLLKIVNPTPDGLEKFTIHAFATRRPEITYETDKKKYKDGIHIIIPSIKTTKTMKRYLVQQLINDKVIERATGGLLNSSVIDKQAASNPALLYGSCKVGKTPYILAGAFMCEIFNDGTIRKNVDNLRSFIDTVDQKNIPYELSINYERSGGLIKKMEFTPRAEISAALIAMERKNNAIIGDSDELSMLAACDPDAAVKLELLNLLGDKRVNEHEHWWKIVTMLGYMGPQYEKVARAFTSKAKDHSNKHTKFNDVWVRAVETPIEQRHPYNLAMLKAMAKEDNPDEYIRIMNNSVMGELTKLIFEGRMTKTQHFNIMKIMHKMNGHMFFTDIEAGGDKAKWWTFCVQDINGDAYKYKPCHDDWRLSEYISEKLPIIFDKARESIEWRRDNATKEKSVKYYNTTIKNVQDTIASLYNDGTKHSLLRQAQVVYRKEGYADKIDRSTNHTGVLNGVLELGNRPRLLTGMHNACVSRRMNARWTGFDPTNEMTIYVWTKYWNMYPKTEKDAFYWINMYKSTAFWNVVKSSLILKGLGNGANGKSFEGESTAELMGDANDSGYGGKIPSAWLFDKDTNADSATAALYQLIWARFAYISETEQSQFVRTSKIKKLTSQERDMYRQLFKNAVSAKHKCLFMFLSNWPFLIKTTEHGIWRRILVYYYKIRFCKNADPSKNECEEDPELNREIISNPIFLSSLLGILATFACLLKMVYKGDITDYPCPTIDRETLEYRSSQDLMHRFISERIVVVRGKQIECEIHEVVDAYIEWYTYTFKMITHDRVDLVHMLGSSIIGNSISKRHRNTYLVNHRVIARGAKPGNNESYVVAPIDNAVGNALQFVDNDLPFQSLMRFWDSYQHLLKKNDTWSSQDELAYKKIWERARKYAQDNNIICESKNGVYDDRNFDIWPIPKTQARKQIAKQPVNEDPEDIDDDGEGDEYDEDNQSEVTSDDGDESD